MENKIYKKVGRRYEPIGLETDWVSDGIWVVNSKPSSKSITSMTWLVGDLKRPVDVVTHASLQKGLEDRLTNYLMKLMDSESEEFKEAKDIKGGYILGSISIYNISPRDLVNLIIRELAISIEEEKV